MMDSLSVTRMRVPTLLLLGVSAWSLMAIGI